MDFWSVFLLLYILLSLDQEDPLAIVSIYPVAEVVTEMIEGIVPGHVLIGKVPEFEATVNQPFFTNVGLSFRIQLRQNIAVVPQDVIYAALKC
jgi:hypothetical protein